MPIERPTGRGTLIDELDRVLDERVAIDTVSLLGVRLARLSPASVEAPGAARSDVAAGAAGASAAT